MSGAHAHRQAGFSLIELLMVILIIGILATLALPRLLGQRSAANDTTAKQNAEIALRAAKAQFLKDETFPTSLVADMAAAEPSVPVVAGSASARDLVNVEWVAASQVILRTQSRSGRHFIIIDDEGAASGNPVTRFSSMSPTPLTNYVPNPSFETNTTGVVVGNAWSTNGRTTSERVTGNYAWTGTMLAGFRNDGNQNKVRFAISGLTPGNTYTATLQVKMPVPTVELGVSALGTAYYGTQYATSKTISSTGNWQSMSITFVPTATTANVWVGPPVINLAADTTYFVDAVVVIDGNQPLGYFDGSSAGASWAGTPHGSLSTGYPDGGW